MLFVLLLMLESVVLVVGEKKRMLLQPGEFDVEREFQALKNNVTLLQFENRNILNKLAAISASNRGHHSIYTHWGRNQCPGNATELIYRGYTSGGHWTVGSGASLACLPETPTWNRYFDGHNDNRGYIYGAEIDIETGTGNVFNTPMNNHDIPCAVCMTPFSVTHMFPGRSGCYNYWTQQYTGYLVSSRHDRNLDLEYYCMDANPETVPHSAVSNDECVLYVVEAKCGSLPCPPYVEGREIACTVCSK